MVILEEAGSGLGWVLRDADAGRTVLFQIDYDCPGLASSLGVWSTKHEGKRGEDCPGARDTDGTVPCPVCGKPTGEFIASAQKALREHEGESFEDPGYFYDFID